LRFAYITFSQKEATEKALSHPSCSPLFVLGSYEECTLYLLEQGRKRRNKEGKEGEESVGWKNYQGSAHISFPKQNVRFLFQLHPLALRSHLRVKPAVGFSLFFHELKYIKCLRIKWTVWA